MDNKSVYRAIAVSTLITVINSTLSSLRGYLDNSSTVCLADKLSAQDLQLVYMLEYAAQVNLLACKYYCSDDAHSSIDKIIEQINNINNLQSLTDAQQNIETLVDHIK